MLTFLERFVTCLIRFITTTPLTLTLEEWIYLLFAMVLCGFVLMRGLGHRGYGA